MDAERLARVEARCERIPAIDAKLNELSDTVTGSLARIEHHLTVLNGSVRDHEDRVRGLERWRYTLPAGIGGAIVIAGEAIKALITGG